MWMIAFWIAIVAVVPVVSLENRAPWVVAVPIVVGILFGIIFEVKDDLRERTYARKFALLRTKQELDAQSDFGSTLCFLDSNLLASYFAESMVKQPQKHPDFTVYLSREQPREDSKIRSQASQANADYARLILAAAR
jgi:hypothetical protein